MGEIAAPTKAGHVAHEVAVRDLELVQPLHLGTGIGHVARPDDLGEFPVRLGGGLVLSEASGEVASSLGARALVIPIVTHCHPNDGGCDQSGGEEEDEYSALLHSPHHPSALSRLHRLPSDAV